MSLRCYGNSAKNLILLIMIFAKRKKTGEKKERKKEKPYTTKSHFYFFTRRIEYLIKSQFYQCSITKYRHFSFFFFKIILLSSRTYTYYRTFKVLTVFVRQWWRRKKKKKHLYTFIGFILSRIFLFRGFFYTPELFSRQCIARMCARDRERFFLGFFFVFTTMGFRGFYNR